MRAGRIILFSTVIFAILTGCFTGVDSTPKITAADVKKQRVVAQAEDSLLSSIDQQPFSQWEKGKRLFVTDDKISIIFEPNSSEQPRVGDVLVYDRFRTVTSFTGEDDTELIFLNSKGQELPYRINSTPEDLAQKPRVEVPFTIEESLVNDARKLLVGQKLYIRTPVWYDSRGNHRNGYKFLPVDIIDVQQGNMIYPVKVKFVADNYGEPDTASVFMNVGAQSRSSRSFSQLFYTKDPHKKYPTISDEHWKLITRGSVVKYMTREECRLALGNPAAVDRRNAISSMKEVWTYDNGLYLVFEDGLLVNLRR